MNTSRLSAASLFACGALLLVSCAPTGGGAGARPSGGDASSNSAPGAGGPKTIRLAVDASSEPAGGMILIGRGGAVGLENYLLFHAGLTVWDQDSKLLPRLAER